MNLSKINQMGTRLFIVCAVTMGLAACGGSGSGSEAEAESGTESGTDIGAPDLNPADALVVDPQQADLLEQVDMASIGGDQDNLLDEDTGDLIPAIFPSETGFDLAFAQSGAAMVEQLNESLVLPADIAVNFADCGVANAFYVPAGFGETESPNLGGTIFMCHELTELFLQLYGDNERAFLASSFVLLHEVGHALVDQLRLPVLGIEESYVDGIGAVFLGEAGLSEGTVLAGWFFFSQPDTPFFDTHRAGPQRLGDLACWGVGADPSLLQDPTIDNIAQQLIASGRNCVAEYNQQLDGLTTVLSGNIRGGLGDALSDDISEGL